MTDLQRQHSCASIIISSHKALQPDKSSKEAQQSTKISGVQGILLPYHSFLLMSEYTGAVAAWGAQACTPAFLPLICAVPRLKGRNSLSWHLERVLMLFWWHLPKPGCQMV